MSITNAITELNSKYSSTNDNYDLGGGNILDLSDGTIDAPDLAAIVAAYSGNNDFNVDGDGDVDSDDARLILTRLLEETATDTNAPTAPRSVTLPGQSRPVTQGASNDGLIASSVNNTPNQTYTEGYHYEQGMSGMMCGMQTTVIHVEGSKLLDTDSNAVIDDLNCDGVQGGDEDIVIANAFVRGLAALESSGDGMLSTAECRSKDTDGNGIITGAELGLDDFEYQFAYNEDTAGALTLTMKSQDGVQSFVSLKECTQGTDGQIDLNSMGLAAASAMVNTAYTDYVERMVILNAVMASLRATLEGKDDSEEVEVGVTDNSIIIDRTATEASSSTITSLGITSGTTTVGELTTLLNTVESGISTAPAAAVITAAAPETTAAPATTAAPETTPSTTTSPTVTAAAPKAITRAVSMNVGRR